MTSWYAIFGIEFYDCKILPTPSVQIQKHLIPRIGFITLALKL